MLLEATITDLRSLRAVTKILQAQAKFFALFLPEHLHKQLKNEWWNTPLDPYSNEYGSPYWSINGVQIIAI